jgi:hypothetical protein
MSEAKPPANLAGLTQKLLEGEQLLGTVQLVDKPFTVNLACGPEEGWRRQ